MKICEKENLCEKIRNSVKDYVQCIVGIWMGLTYRARWRHNAKKMKIWENKMKISEKKWKSVGDHV